MLSEIPQLITPRLLLRAIYQSDAQLVHRNLCDSQTVLYSNAAESPSLEKVEQMIEKWEQDFKKQQGIRWGITIKRENAVIGSCGYKKFNKKHKRAEIGYEIFANYRRQGFISEALNSIFQFGFEIMGLNRIEATVDCDNFASISLLQKLGFIEEEILQEYDNHNQRFIDLKLFSLLRKAN